MVVHSLLLRPRRRLLAGSARCRARSSARASRLGGLHLANNSIACSRGHRHWLAAWGCATWLLGQLGHRLLVQAAADIVTAAIRGLRRSGWGSSCGCHGASTGSGGGGDIMDGRVAVAAAAVATAAIAPAGRVAATAVSPAAIPATSIAPAAVPATAIATAAFATAAVAARAMGGGRWQAMGGSMAVVVAAVPIPIVAVAIPVAIAIAKVGGAGVSVLATTAVVAAAAVLFIAATRRMAVSVVAVAMAIAVASMEAGGQRGRGRQVQLGAHTVAIPIAIGVTCNRSGRELGEESAASRRPEKFGTRRGAQAQLELADRVS